MQLGDFTALEGSIFNVRTLEVRPYEFPDDIHLSVSYEFDLDFHRIDRETYNSLDWLGDLGGLKEALAGLFGAIYVLFHYQTFENYLVSQLFKTYPAEGADEPPKDNIEENVLDIRKLSCLL